jgi:integrase
MSACGKGNGSGPALYRVGDWRRCHVARDLTSQDGNRWRIFLHTEKSGNPVFLPIPSDVKAALDALPVPRGCDASNHYFWHGVTSERAMKGMTERMLAAAFRKSGVPRAHAHRFRHTWQQNYWAAARASRTWRTFSGIRLRLSVSITLNGPLLVRRALMTSWRKFTPERITPLRFGSISSGRI